MENHQPVVSDVSTIDSMADFFTKPLNASTFFAMGNQIMKSRRNELLRFFVPMRLADVHGEVSRTSVLIKVQITDNEGVYFVWRTLTLY